MKTVEKYILFCLRYKIFKLNLNKALTTYFLKKEFKLVILFLKMKPVIGPRCVLGGKRANIKKFHNGKKFK